MREPPSPYARPAPTRDCSDDDAKRDAWLATHKPTLCPPAIVAPTTGVVLGEAARLVEPESASYADKHSRMWAAEKRRAAQLAAGRSSAQKTSDERRQAAAKERYRRLLRDFRAAGGDAASRQGKADIVKAMARKERLTATQIRALLARGREDEAKARRRQIDGRAA